MLKSLVLQNFRNYSKRKFEFSDKATLIVGPNAIGKTNILEAIYLLSTGRSFRADLEKEVIKEEAEVGRIFGISEKEELEIIWDRRDRFSKLYKVNGVGKRQVDFVGILKAVLFSPLDLDIVIGSPSTRRRYLDLVLSQVNKDYRLAAHIYERAVRQRNRILQRAKKDGLTSRDIGGTLEYWNELLISNGKIIHEKRKEFLDFLNDFPTRVFQIAIKYDHSIISLERILKYREEEVAAGVTLVGPHRDDFVIYERGDEKRRLRDLRLFGSRGEQRLGIFAIKLGELDFVQKITGESPILLLDDIFSELDHSNRHHILEVIPKQQTIMTTTDLHLVEKTYLKHVNLVELGKTT